MVQPVNNESIASLILLGIKRSSLGFVLEHPLELTKIVSQINPSLSTIQIIKKIFQNKGIAGFTDAILVNFPKRALKESVRWPVMALTNDYLVQQLPNYFTKEGNSAKIISALFVALFNTSVILPFEQLMTWRLKTNAKYSTFFLKTVKNQGLSALYPAARISLVHQGILWSTYLTVNNEVKKKFDIYDEQKAHPYMRQAVTSLLTAAYLIIFASPVDFTKAWIQADKELQNLKIRDVAKILYRRHGFIGFYAGTPTNFVHTVFHATISGYVIDHIFK
jgi:hypothetical protein